MNNFIFKSTLNIKEILPKSSHFSARRFKIQWIWGNHFETRQVSPRLILRRVTSMVQWNPTIQKSVNQGYFAGRFGILWQVVLQSYFGKQLPNSFSREVFFSEGSTNWGTIKFTKYEASQWSSWSNQVKSHYSSRDKNQHRACQAAKQKLEFCKPSSWCQNYLRQIVSGNQSLIPTKYIKPIY